MSNGGPRTRGGKAVSSRNATRHGILAMVPVVPGMEQTGDWESHLAGVFQSLSPEGDVEELLAQRIALQFWRLRRVERYETTAIATAQESAATDVARRHARLELYENSPCIQIKDARARLDESRRLLRRLREIPALPGDMLLFSPEVAEIMEKLEEVTVEATRDTISVPFLQEGEAIESRTEWTAAELRELLATLAAADGQELNQLLEKALEEPQRQLDQLEQNLAELTARVEQDQIKKNAEVEQLRRERMLPSDKDLEKVARYEALLSLELYKAMHELEALQERRLGRPLPLARLEINGLPAN